MPTSTHHLSTNYCVKQLLHYFQVHLFFPVMQWKKWYALQQNVSAPSMLPALFLLKNRCHYPEMKFSCTLLGLWSCWLQKFMNTNEGEGPSSQRYSKFIGSMGCKFQMLYWNLICFILLYWFWNNVTDLWGWWFDPWCARWLPKWHAPMNCVYTRRGRRLACVAIG